MSEAPAPLARPTRSSLPVLGIVGGIGSGKSAVAAALAAEGCLVCDSDALGAQALRDPAVAAQLRAWWGDRVFDANGHADRSRIAAIVFADPAERTRLEGLVHPWIEARRRELFAHPPAATRALVIDAPLLLEAGLGAQCTAVIFVETPVEMRQKRVLDTRGWTPQEHSRRESAQWPLDRKRNCAHHVVRNDGSSDALRAQVRRVLEEVLASHGGAHH
ncbi:MAG: dephospho-CoA kinase [Phycisphaerae bacterium]|nr:dephospho-CoA kinase [Phycisphaerae bacterium]